MAWILRHALKRRNIIAALFVFGVLYMMRQLLSLREVDVGVAIRRSRSSSAASTVTSSKTLRPAVAPPAQAALPSHKVRGVSPDEVAHYMPGKTFKCLRSSGVIGYDQVNDDYCDCKDSSDEPGTSACPNGRRAASSGGRIPSAVQGALLIVTETCYEFQPSTVFQHDRLVAAPRVM
ncbi:hypothetical protein HPB50_006010 [Hyalomma asiaticum]|uniref:Uncharacterized protein n=1 Tax=Hyalomma asiaticum TaxID=266040 RepID=A0ACB7SKF9_HYAAI|nr:hypothetical protein HPB50_006010 [Hyalomma asiaticum]